MIYNKPAISIDDQISLLQDRGLEFESIQIAKKYLAHISYYRLAGYWWPMYEDKVNHNFKPNSKFKDVVALYNFDHKLRMLLFDVIEKIEISFRTKLIYHLSIELDPWWFADSENFSDEADHKKTLASIKREINRSKDQFIRAHKEDYHEDTRLPPAWKTLEVASLGSLSRLYGNLKGNIRSKKNIARELGAVNQTYLPSWLHSISQIRNICAHHGRLWNKNLPTTVKLLPKPKRAWIKQVPEANEFKHLYVHMCVMKYLLNIIDPTNSFGAKLNCLMKEYQRNVDPNALGFKENWVKEELWRTKKSSFEVFTKVKVALCDFWNK
ncbi:MAG: Abi family protein [Roseivirga sp.]|uniref:Abi family protein n=1 Tax=Roseivirga sp. TaxID=1964215 RepID=UPI001B0E1832|nr:Abi family protein [Roseivirga sp.]MBO6659341.1 Abi family protein [Roseivirga sp.]MBO6761827.1 Abi family protein [Roseivirga sp.]MBO6907922.1 Abi family protein [Roseivirga sp.]